MLMLRQVQPRIAQGDLPIPEDLMPSLPTIWGSYSPAMCTGRVLVYTEANFYSQQGSASTLFNHSPATSFESFKSVASRNPMCRQQPTTGLAGQLCFSHCKKVFTLIPMPAMLTRLAISVLEIFRPRFACRSRSVQHISSKTLGTGDLSLKHESSFKKSEVQQAVVVFQNIC